MKAFWGVVFLLFVQTVVFAQSAMSPSVSAMAKTAQQKTIDSINESGFKIYLEYPDSARAIAEKALLLAERSKYQFGIGRGFMIIGYVYWAQSYYPVAMGYI